MSTPPADAAPAETDGSSPARATALAAAVPVLLIALMYVPAALQAGFIADDIKLLAHHAHPGDWLGEWTRSTHQHATNVEGGYVWRPLTATLHQLAGELFGRTPPVFRLLNTALHALNAVGVVLVARRLGASALTAALLATAWAMHPLLPDAVCWASATYDLQAATLLLPALWVGLSERLSTGGRVAGVATLTLLALLCKEPAIGFVGAFPLVMLALRGRREALLHALGCGLAAGLHALWHRAVVGDAEAAALGLLGPKDVIGVWTDYLGWIVSPVAAGYTHLVVPGQEPLHVGALVGLAAAFAGAAALGRQRGAALAGAALCWAVLLVPAAAAAVAIGQQASRYLYLPSALAFALLGGVRLPLDAGRSRALAALVCAGLIAIWSPRTAWRIQDWQSERALFIAEHEAEPNNTVSARVVGRILTREGQTEAGLALWRQAIDHPIPYGMFYDRQRERLDYAVAALGAGRREEARQVLEDFIADEAAAGRTLDPSVVALRAKIAEIPAVP